jgi:hypothetical protein
MSSMVSGIGWPNVSGNAKHMSPAVKARIPYTRYGKVWWTSACRDKNNYDYYLMTTKFASRRDEAIWHIFTEVPKSATNPKTTPTEGYTWAAGFPVSTSHFAVIGIPHTARYALQSVSRQFNCLLGPNIRGWPHRREPYERSRFFEYPYLGGANSRTITHCTSGEPQRSTVHNHITAFCQYWKG